MSKRWLGVPDRFARRHRIATLDPVKDHREIAALFSEDFASVMLPLVYGGLLFTYAIPRMSRVLIGTGQLEHNVAKRIVDMALLARAVLTDGLGPGPGRTAAQRVNAMHRNYDLHDDDFIAVACDETLMALDLADRFGWRPVTDAERTAVRLHYFTQARAFGGHGAPLESLDEVRAFWHGYVDEQARFEPQNARLAVVLEGYFADLVPAGLGKALPPLLRAQVDPRILRACGLPAAGRPLRAASSGAFRLLGRRDPIHDDAPDGLELLVKRVYPDGWELSSLGTHLAPRPTPAGE